MRILLHLGSLFSGYNDKYLYRILGMTIRMLICNKYEIEKSQFESPFWTVLIRTEFITILIHEEKANILYHIHITFEMWTIARI